MKDKMRSFSLDRAYCEKCGMSFPADVKEEEIVCPACGSLVKSSNENMVRIELNKCQCAKCGRCIGIASSAKIPLCPWCSGSENIQSHPVN